MRRLFVAPAQLVGPVIALDDEQRRYLAVLRLAAGDELELFDGRGGRFAARVTGPATLALGPALAKDAGAAFDVTLAQGLAKGDKLDLVVQKATELGVSRFVPLATERSVVKLEPQRALERVARWQRIAQEASRQCGRADVPEVAAPSTLAALAEPGRLCLLLDPEATLRLSAAARGASKLLLAIGPEGGFSPEERDAALAAGMIAVSLGPLVLRTETAGLAALSVLQHLHGQLG